MRKRFNASGVLGVVTGRCLRSMSDIHEVMDHFCPGIMTIGLAAMMSTVTKEILRQIPSLEAAYADRDSITPENVDRWFADAIAKYGSEFELEAVEPSAEDTAKAFAELRARLTA